MIYILDSDPKKTAEYLDDRSLDKMLKDVGQILCNAYEEVLQNKYNPDGTLLNYPKNYYKESNPIPLKWDGNKGNKSKWTQWARECKANYEYLVELLYELINEYSFRFETDKFYSEYFDIMRWSRNNVPELPKSKFRNIKNKGVSPFPLVMPKKFSEYYKGWEPPRTIAAYRNYYQAKLKQSYKRWQIESNKLIGGTRYLKTTHLFTKWTQRERPEWLGGLDD